VNEVIASYLLAVDIHVILDKRSTHKPKDDQWLARHKSVHFHYTPTHASWLNQIEVWFSILFRAAPGDTGFPSPAEVRAAIDAFVRSTIRTPSPSNGAEKWCMQYRFE
jgi:hypothetical protein